MQGFQRGTYFHSGSSLIPPEAEFVLDVEKGDDCSIPTHVFRRCVGKQAPFAPHAQRLLVASLKSAKADGGGKHDPASKAVPKAKAKRDPKPKSSPKKKKTKAETKDGNETAEAKPKQKTPYALAKDAFMLKFLGSNNPSIQDSSCML